MQHIGIRFEDETGKIVEELPTNFVFVMAFLWDEGKQESYPWLAGIDPYGKTVFNALQAPHLIKELESLLKESSDDMVNKVARESIEYFRAVDEDRYLRFVGD
jgi:hypothetical protein